jgi:hypothetical protein
LGFLSSGVSSQRVGDIIENTTLSTDMLFIIARSSNTSSTIHRSRVGSTLRSGLSLQTDVTILSPSGSPAVSDNPEVTLSSISTITNHLDSMIQTDVIREAAPVKDTARVEAPVGGIYSNSQRTNVSKVEHGGILIIRHGVITSDSNNRGSIGDIIQTVSGLKGVSRLVRVAVFCGMSEKLDVSVAKLRDGSHATTGTTASQSVRGAGSDLLGGKHSHGTGSDGSIGLNHLSGGKGPARSTGALVLDSRYSSRISPVNRFREVLGINLDRLLSSTFRLGQSLVTSKALGLEFFLGHVGELVDAKLVAESSFVVGLNHLHVLSKDLET